MRQLDAAAMFGSLFLLALMVLDLLTPEELTSFMIGVAIAPAAVVSAVLYWLDVPRIDFAIAFATLWLVSGMILDLVTPRPLSPWMTAATVVPPLIVGSVDTRMADHVEGVKEDPRDIAIAGLKAMARGERIFDTDRMAVEARAKYVLDPVRWERGMAKVLNSGNLSTGRN